MSEISITIRDRTPELMQKLDAAIERFVVKGADYIQGQLERTLNLGDRSGRIYKRGKTRIHQASAPGEPPKSDSSNLVGSIQQIFPSTLEAKIGTPVEYALYLEDPNGLNRPLWQKTADDSLPTLEKMLNDEIEGIR